MSKFRSILLRSDDYSPMGKPHGLAALYWQGLTKDLDANTIESRLSESGWSPQWRFTMYGQAHYHSTTHELLTVIQGSAKIQLGGTDERAHPKNQVKEDSCLDINLGIGDVLLLPAGYSHRSIETYSGFKMIGSYPRLSQQWDMRFPNVMGCPHDCKSIEEVVNNSKRKALFDAQSPDTIFNAGNSKDNDLRRNWDV